MITSIDRAVLRVMFQWVAIVALLGTPASSLSARRVLVVGGNGRVGGSTAKYLHLLSTSSGESPVELVLGGRSKETFKMSKQRILRQLADDSVKDLPSIEFQELDLDGPAGSLEEALQQCKAKCVVHTAGPFQQREDPALMRAAISCGLPYVDVCDEVALCEAGKKLDAEAKAKGTVAVVAGGIWPGASALMAAEVIAKLRELDAQGSSSGDSSGEMLEGPCEGEKVDLSFFTAGTGNAGATIVSATFLLLCQPALTFVAGKLNEKEPWSEPLEVDFGKGVGVRTVRLLDNPDVYTIQSALKVPTLCSRFATAPGCAPSGERPNGLGLGCRAS
mmetsp:Transcript_28817/g.64428  ORF Transcript_28817/g.64428 Transcript_28817/m.64428 type:complete len:333 (-) Transcript_28817:39-1037(-)